MANFLVRVELFKADGDDYSDLHEGMSALGLERTVTFSDGKKHKLPIGTYFGSSSASPGELRDKVRNVANPQSPYRDAAVFVCQSADWSAWLYAD